MLFSHIAHGNLDSSAVHDGHTEHLLGQKNALGMVAKGSVTEVCQECFRLIKPVVNREIVLRFSTELPRAVLCVFEWMGQYLHLVRGHRVVFPIVALDRQFARAHIEDDISETTAIVLISERHENFEVFLQM